jgi:hypothetical protein
LLGNLIMVTLKTFVEYAATLTNKWVKVALVSGSPDVNGLLVEAQADYLLIGRGKDQAAYRIVHVLSLTETAPPSAAHA